MSHICLVIGLISKFVNNKKRYIYLLLKEFWGILKEQQHLEYYFKIKINYKFICWVIYLNWCENNNDKNHRFVFIQILRCVNLLWPVWGCIVPADESEGAHLFGSTNKGGWGSKRVGRWELEVSSHSCREIRERREKRERHIETHMQ